MAVPKVKVIRVGTPRFMRARRYAGRAMTAVANRAREEKHTIAAIGAAAALGFAQKQGWNLPHLPFLGTAGTYGALAYVASRYAGGRTLRHVATGLLAVAAYQLTATGSIAGDDDLAGDLDIDE